MYKQYATTVQTTLLSDLFHQLWRIRLEKKKPKAGMGDLSFHSFCR